MVGPNFRSKFPQAGHRKSSYSDSTALGSLVPSLVMSLLGGHLDRLRLAGGDFLSLDITI